MDTDRVCVRAKLVSLASICDALVYEMIHCLFRRIVAETSVLGGALKTVKVSLVIAVGSQKLSQVEIELGSLP